MAREGQREREGSWGKKGFPLEQQRVQGRSLSKKAGGLGREGGVAGRQGPRCLKESSGPIIIHRRTQGRGGSTGHGSFYLSTTPCKSSLVVCYGSSSIIIIDTRKKKRRRKRKRKRRGRGRDWD